MGWFDGISTEGRYALLAATIAVLIAFLYSVHYWNEHYRKHQPDILKASPPMEDEATVDGGDNPGEDRV
jgi:hypothetical protein